MHGKLQFETASFIIHGKECVCLALRPLSKEISLRRSLSALLQQSKQDQTATTTDIHGVGGRHRGGSEVTPETAQTKQDECQTE